jgi:hypothetical protein
MIFKQMCGDLVWAIACEGQDIVVFHSLAKCRLSWDRWKTPEGYRWLHSPNRNPVSGHSIAEAISGIWFMQSPKSIVLDVCDDDGVDRG